MKIECHEHDDHTMIECHDQDTRDSTDRAGAVDALAGVARVLAELAGVGQHGGGGEAGGAATYTVIKKILS